MSQSKRTPLGVTLFATLAVLATAGGAFAAPVYIPNASFESPNTPYAGPVIDSWQKAAVPAWWPDTTENWNNMAGIFANAPGSQWIDNVEGQQIAFLFSAPGAELYQDLTATYEVGQAYSLTARFQGGGYGMPVGTPLEMRLFYRDGDGNRVTIGAQQVLNTTDESLPHAKHLDPAQLVIPTVAADAPWAGQPIGVEIISTAPFAPLFGYWRFDDVQLNTVPEPASALLLLAGVALFKTRRSQRMARK